MYLSVLVLVIDLSTGQLMTYLEPVEIVLQKGWWSLSCGERKALYS